MFRWYRKSIICYAYLSDIPEVFSVYDPNWSGLFDVKGRFKWSRWFTRGWTLQELIAPQIVEFYAADWKPIGTKEKLQNEIAAITGIDPGALLGEDLSTFNIAQRMSWASQRSTTRLEDRAYSLLGIFQVNMPLVYGEGNRAFLRLQEEILKNTEDYTIFAWPGAEYGDYTLRVEPSNAEDEVSIFASDPAQFRRLEGCPWRYSDLVRIRNEELNANSAPTSSESRELDGLETDYSPSAITGRGVSICFPLMHLRSRNYLASTYYKLKTTGEWVCIVLTRSRLDPEKFARNTWDSHGIHLAFASPGYTFKRCRIYGERLNPVPSPLRKTKRSVLRSTIRGRITKGGNAQRNRLHKDAEMEYELAARLSRRIFGSRHMDTLDCDYGLLTAYLSQDRPDEAELLALELVNATKASMHKNTMKPLESVGYRAAILFQENHWSAAERLFADLVGSYDLVMGKAHNDTLHIMGKRAEHILNGKDHQKGYQYAREVLQRFEDSIADRPDVDACVDKHVAWLKSTRIRWASAEEMLKTLLGLSRSTKGETDPITLLIMFCLVLSYSHKPNFERLEGRAIREEVLEISRRDLGANHRWKVICYAVYVGMKDLLQLGCR